MGNPFAASDVGAVYSQGRPYHHPRTLARVRSQLGRLERGLDVACGTGMSTIALRDYADTVVGVDISPAMMRAATRPDRPKPAPLCVISSWVWTSNRPTPATR